MCDYCDCRSHAELAALSADHERTTRLLSAIAHAAAAGDESAGRALTDELIELLDRHAAREDEGVFDALRAEVGDDYMAVFDADHDDVRRLLGAAAADWRSAMSELTDVLAAHFLREESDLFPAAHQLLAPAQWASIDQRALTGAST